jgi:hypothetical protein
MANARKGNGGGRGMTNIREICKSLAVAAEELEKAEVARAYLIGDLVRDLLHTVSLVNRYADKRDLELNLINYGITVQIVYTLNLLKINTGTQVCNDDEFYRIPKVIIEGKETVFTASDKGAAE